MKIPWGINNKKDKSLGLFHGEAASSSIENAGCSFQSYSIIATGADAGGVGILSILTNIVLSVVLIKVPSLIEGQQNSLKKTTVIISFVSALTWLPIIFSLFFIHSLSPFLLIGLWIISLVPTILLGPLRDIWLANSVPGDNMGRYLGWRSVITSAFYLVFLNLMAKVVDLFGGQKTHGYAVILAMAFFASLISVFFYTRIKTPVQATITDKEPTLGFLDFLKQAKKNHLGIFILFVAMFTFAVNISSPYFASYMKDDLRFSLGIINIIVSCEFIARIISLTYWGKLIDKSGSLKVLSMVTYFIPIVPVLWLFSSSVIYLCAIQVFSGVIWSAFDLCIQTFIFKATSPSQRLRYIVYYRSLSSFSVAMGGFTGLILIGRVVPIFGSGILTLFVISGILRLIIARVMIPKLTPEGIPGAIIHDELAAELEALNTPAFPDGLYYHPEAWGRFSRRAYIIGNSIGKTIGKLNPVKLGLFYQTNQWSNFVKTKTQNIDKTDNIKGIYNKPQAWADYIKRGEVTQNQTAENNQPFTPEGIYRKPQAWVDYMKQAGLFLTPTTTNNRQRVSEGLYYHQEEWLEKNIKMTTAFAKGNNQPSVKKGLFHNPGQWLDYLKQGVLLNATTAIISGDSIINRQPIYYHPEAWIKYKQETPKSRNTSDKVTAVRQPLLYHPEDWKRFETTLTERKPRKSRIAHPAALAPSDIPRQLKRRYAVSKTPTNNTNRAPKLKKLYPSPIQVHTRI